MKKKPTSQSGIFNTRVVIAIALCTLGASLGWLSFAATPASGTLSFATPTLTYQTGPNVQSNPSGQVGLVCNAALPCDNYTLTVNVPAGTETTHNVVITIQWPVAAEDYDVYILQNNVVIKTAASSADPEIAILDAAPAIGANAYTIRVVPFAVAGSTFTGRIELVEKQTTTIPDPPGPGTPRYHNFAAPAGMGNSAGEPTLGTGIFTQPAGGRTMFIAGLETLRVTWNDCSSPASSPAFPADPDLFNPLWADVSAPTTSVTSLDPILWTDYAGDTKTGRTFVSQLGPKTSFLAFSDNDGGTNGQAPGDWTPSQGSGINSGVDHQNIGGGPYKENTVPPPPPLATRTYPNAIYYASQDVAVAQMGRSDTGGLTFGPAVPMYNLTQCGGLHGHVKVTPDTPQTRANGRIGTVYLPNKGCGTTQGVVVSKDNGTTFVVRNVPGSSPGDTDPSLGIDATGKIYFAFADGDGRAKVAVSDDEGTTWSTPVDVGAPFGIKNTVFPGAVGGSAGRATVMYLATDTGGGYEAIGVFQGVWHIYASHTFDGGLTWTTVRVTPENDPVQRGSMCTSGTTCGADRNLLDFNDVEIDYEGRVIIGYADGCIGCTSPTGADSRSAKATIARQSGGKRMLAGFGPEDVSGNTTEPNEPAAPRVNEVGEASPGNVHLAWSEPDNGGSPLTGYKVYRRTDPGVYGAPLATVTLNCPACKTTYDDTTAVPATAYFYKVTALNAIGEGVNCGEFPVGEIADPGTACILPGLKKLGPDPGVGGTAPGPAGPGMDLDSMYLAQPYIPGGTDADILLVFRINTDPGLSPQPVGTVWFVSMLMPDAGVRGVRMAWKATPAGEPTFESYVSTLSQAGTADGRFVDPASLTPTEPSSNYDPDSGIITIVVKATQLGLAPGSLINGFNSAVTETTDPLVIGAGATFTLDEMPNGLARTGTYLVTPNAVCAPNVIPIADLSASPLTGDAPLMVNFNASGSFDPDAGDSVVSYTFNFGDGSPEVTQATPTISHNYTDWGNFRATVRVKDSHDAVSTNPADAVIQVGLPLTDIVSTKVHGIAGAFPIVLPTDGQPGVECRTGGTNNDYTIVYTFDRNLTGVGSATVSQGTGTVNANSGIGPAPNQYTVNLTGVTNAQHLVVELDGVQDTAGAFLNNVLARMDVLYCDVNAVSGVTGSDVNICKSQVGLTLSMDNFRNDVNVTGFVSGSDVNLIKSQVGMTLPAGAEPSSPPPEPASPAPQPIAPQPGRTAPPAKLRPASGVKQPTIRTDRPAPVSER